MLTQFNMSFHITACKSEQNHICLVQKNSAKVSPEKHDKINAYMHNEGIVAMFS